MGQGMKLDTAMIEKTLVMMAMQNEMNCRVDADWIFKEREWYRAIWIECAELMDHYGGWKWWKHSTPDLPQAILEIVDIWHFGLSLRLGTGSDVRACAEQIVSEWQEEVDGAGDFLQEVERLAVMSLSEKRFAVASVRTLLRLCECDFNDLYRSYVAKNVLNMFRQDHGYKTGGYIKIWHGREDNEVLAGLIDELDSDHVNFRELMYAALDESYRSVVSG
jgi:dimeric dUTPase (all-alpha-NTP-PPase superfamily)